MRLRVDISGHWCLPGRGAVGLSVPEQLQPCLDVRVVGVQFRSALVRVESIGNLIVARLILVIVALVSKGKVSGTRCRAQATYESTQIIPDFRDPWVEPDGPRVRIQRVTVLVDLVIQHSDRAPEGGIPAVAVNGLLVSFVRLGILLHLHVAAAEEIPALRIRVVYVALGHLCYTSGTSVEGAQRHTGRNRLLQIFNRSVLAVKLVGLGVMQPAQLLEDLGMVGITVKDTVICCLRILELGHS